MDISFSNTWFAIGSSIRGPTHYRNGLPNQDRINWCPKGLGKSSPQLVLAVADGHGSPKYFRSHVGARKATDCALRISNKILVNAELEHSDLTKIKRLLEERLPREIVQNWREAVRKDYVKRPFTNEELSDLEMKAGHQARLSIETNPMVAYGSTLLFVIVAKTFLSIFQLGDGDILVISDSGEVSRPIRRDERLFANETTSLCDVSAWINFQTSFTPIFEKPPALVIISTDGYSNSFRDEEGFLKVGTDFLELFQTEDVIQISHSLREWLKDVAISGSGDDISLGIIYRNDLAKNDQAKFVINQVGSASADNVNLLINELKPTPPNTEDIENEINT